VPGASANDVCLAAVGGALRRYLSYHGELPEVSLLTMVPVSVRARAEKGSGGNRVSAMFVPLGTNMADPIARLTRITNATRRSRGFAAEVGARDLSGYTDFITGDLASLVTQSTWFGMATGSDTLVNTVVTNVPSARSPLYFAGARLTEIFGTAPIADSLGLMHVVVTYNGTVTVTFTSCPSMLGDPSTYSASIEDSFAELFAAADAAQ
jgi:WS/DGAT/MGAT family acyltransferase